MELLGKRFFLVQSFLGESYSTAPKMTAWEARERGINNTVDFNHLELPYATLKIWFMLSVRISGYGCTWEVGEHSSTIARVALDNAWSNLHFSHALQTSCACIHNLRTLSMNQFAQCPVSRLLFFCTQYGGLFWEILSSDKNKMKDRIQFISSQNVLEMQKFSKFIKTV